MYGGLCACHALRRAQHYDKLSVDTGYPLSASLLCFWRNAGKVTDLVAHLMAPALSALACQQGLLFLLFPEMQEDVSIDDT